MQRIVAGGQNLLRAAANYDDRAFLARGDGMVSSRFDYVSGAEPDVAVAQLFVPLSPATGDVLIGFGWAMAEYLDALLSAA